MNHDHQTVITVGKTSVNAIAMPSKAGMIMGCPDGEVGEYHDHVWHADIADVIANDGKITSSVDNGHSHELVIPINVKMIGLRSIRRRVRFWRH